MLSSNRAIEGALAEGIVRAYVAPGATACVAWKRGSAWSFELGAAGIRSAQRPDRVKPDSVFDLASVTKPVLALIVARLEDRGKLRLDDRLSDALPELRGPARNSTLESLLSHRAGLQAHLELFEPLTRGADTDLEDALQQAAHARRPECIGPEPAGGFPPLYSDLGYLLVGAYVERRLGLALDTVVNEELAAAGLDEIASARLWKCGPRHEFAARVVPTETVAYRGGEIVGAVHDDNAWALSGFGICGHAGLFGTALGVARLGSKILDALTSDTALLSTDSVMRMVQRRPLGSLRMGFDGRSVDSSSIGKRLGNETFGHLGFTGTSLWMDPERHVVVVLLCNRVCPSRESPRIREARPRVHDALFDAVFAPRTG